MTSRQPLIVVVEDDADMSRAMESMLSAAGFAASMHVSAEALLAFGVPVTAACLVLDVHLPGMSGFDLLDRLAAPPPVIFMTAHDEPAARARSQKAGAVAYLVKPFDGKALVAMLHACCGRDLVRNGAFSTGGSHESQ
jgi:FixJ family two-component response regulator